jgi:hypothetical protein
MTLARTVVDRQEAPTAEATGLRLKDDGGGLTIAMSKDRRIGIWRARECQAEFQMDRDQIVKELKMLEARIATANERIMRHRERIGSLEARGFKAEFEKTIVRECENMLELQLSNKQRLLKQLSLRRR